MDFHSIISTPFGKLGINLDLATNALCNMEFLPATIAVKDSDLPLIKEVVFQLQQYFADPHFVFALPLLFQGTALHKRIWQEMTLIPVGETLTYGALAKKVQTCARIVGNACRRNPIPIIVPCHRIVAANGMGGFSGELQGEMIAIKEWLLQHEKQKI